jgi:hypothetical protein
MSHCNLNESDFLRLYNPVQSGGQPFFQANLRRQRGNGIGGIFGSIGRFLLPLVKKYILPRAATAARNVAKDVFAGQNVGQSLRTHGLGGLQSAGREFISDLAQGNLPQSGSGRGRKRPAARDNCRVAKKKPRDIYPNSQLN